MNRELKAMRNNAETIERSIERTRIFAKENPKSVIDFEAILKAQYNLLNSIHDVICDLVIEDIKSPFWKKLFRK